MMQVVDERGLGVDGGDERGEPALRLLFLTHSVVGDRSYGGPMRGNALRDALCARSQVDTVTVYAAGQLHLPDQWGPDRARTATVSRTGASRGAFADRRAVRAWLTNLVDSGGYDLVVAQYMELARLLPVRIRRRTIFDPDDFLKRSEPGVRSSVIERAKRGRRNLLARQVAKQALHVWFANPRPDQLPPTTRRSFLPNVIAPPERQGARGHVEPGHLLMVGSFFHPPNVEGLTWFAEQVLSGLSHRFDGLQMHVVGRCDAGLPRRLPDVRFHGYVHDLTSAYDRAALVVAPIRSGGGTQIKVIDALMHGRPTVVSDFAFAGFADDLVSGRDLRTASTAMEWSDACAWVLEHPGEAEEMGIRGEQVARARFGPERMATEVQATLERAGREVRSRR